MDTPTWATAEQQIGECRRIAIELRGEADELDATAEHWERTLDLAERAKAT